MAATARRQGRVWRRIQAIDRTGCRTNLQLLRSMNGYLQDRNATRFGQTAGSVRRRVASSTHVRAHWRGM